ncbi:hypothetical protein [uncultured Propionivibrio sp.]|uniref:hypothetical protein n=1 Tax=uncultured Propionivibrio sp. TaxID=426737 RepID=UPI0029C0AD9B|nr:hypothetical protein [uncultured Propionivibrio sp.]
MIDLLTQGSQEGNAKDSTSLFFCRFSVIDVVSGDLGNAADFPCDAYVAIIAGWPAPAFRLFRSTAS